MYFIYKITNLVNQKSYIGSSKQERGFQTRWYEHQQNARLEKRVGYNYPLYKAIRKYGLENFTYEIIIKDIETQEERERLEHNNIVCYNSMSNLNGYNQTSDTHYGLADPDIREKLCTKICGININNPDDIIYYNSVSEAAQEENTDRGSLHKCIKGDTRYWVVRNRIWRIVENDEIIDTEISIQERLDEYNRTNPVINGERHNITEWLSIYDLARPSFYKRIKKGMSVVEALITPKKR